MWPLVNGARGWIFPHVSHRLVIWWLFHMQKHASYEIEFHLFDMWHHHMIVPHVFIPNAICPKCGTL
jgi:hypothetical protein